VVALPPPGIPDDLEPVDYTLLAQLFRGVRLPEIAQALGRPVDECLARSVRPAFVDLQRDVKQGILVAITATGEAEPVTLAKVNAPGAMKRILALSKTTTDPRVYLQANTKVLDYAGIQPPEPFEKVTPERILDQMTPAELHHYAETREWPHRFATQLRHLMASGSALAMESTSQTTTTTRRVIITPPPVPGSPATQEEPDEADLPVQILPHLPT
jgi:hypothetical protein